MMVYEVDASGDCTAVVRGVGGSVGQVVFSKTQLPPASSGSLLCSGLHLRGNSPECLGTNCCAKTDTLFSVMGATQAPMGIWRALCQPPGFDLENLSAVTLRTLSSILRSPGVGQCPTTGWVGWSQPVPPAQGRFSPVWFLGLKS